MGRGGVGRVRGGWVTGPPHRGVVWLPAPPRPIVPAARGVHGGKPTRPARGGLQPSPAPTPSMPDLGVVSSTESVILAVHGRPSRRTRLPTTPARPSDAASVGTGRRIPWSLAEAAAIIRRGPDGGGVPALPWLVGCIGDAVGVASRLGGAALIPGGELARWRRAVVMVLLDYGSSAPPGATSPRDVDALVAMLPLLAQLRELDHRVMDAWASCWMRACGATAGGDGGASMQALSPLTVARLADGVMALHDASRVQYGRRAGGGGPIPPVSDGWCAWAHSQVSRVHGHGAGAHATEATAQPSTIAAAVPGVHSGMEVNAGTLAVSSWSPLAITAADMAASSKLSPPRVPAWVHTCDHATPAHASPWIMTNVLADALARTCQVLHGHMTSNPVASRALPGGTTAPAVAPTATPAPWLPGVAWCAALMSAAEGEVAMLVRAHGETGAVSNTTAAATRLLQALLPCLDAATARAAQAAALAPGGDDGHAVLDVQAWLSLAHRCLATAATLTGLQWGTVDATDVGEEVGALQDGAHDASPLPGHGDSRSPIHVLHRIAMTATMHACRQLCTCPTLWLDGTPGTGAARVAMEMDCVHAAWQVWWAWRGVTGRASMDATAKDGTGDTTRTPASPVTACHALVAGMGRVWGVPHAAAACTAIFPAPSTATGAARAQGGSSSSALTALLSSSASGAIMSTPAPGSGGSGVIAPFLAHVQSSHAWPTVLSHLAAARWLVVECAVLAGVGGSGSMCGPSAPFLTAAARASDSTASAPAPAVGLPFTMLVYVHKLNRLAGAVVQDCQAHVAKAVGGIHPWPPALARSWIARLHIDHGLLHWLPSLHAPVLGAVAGRPPFPMEHGGGGGGVAAAPPTAWPQPVKVALHGWITAQFPHLVRHDGGDGGGPAPSQQGATLPMAPAARRASLREAMAHALVPGIPPHVYGHALNVLVAAEAEVRGGGPLAPATQAAMAALLSNHGRHALHALMDLAHPASVAARPVASENGHDGGAVPPALPFDVTGIVFQPTAILTDGTGPSAPGSDDDTTAAALVQQLVRGLIRAKLSGKRGSMPLATPATAHHPITTVTQPARVATPPATSGDSASHRHTTTPFDAGWLGTGDVAMDVHPVGMVEVEGVVAGGEGEGEGALTNVRLPTAARLRWWGVVDAGCRVGQREEEVEGAGRMGDGEGGGSDSEGFIARSMSSWSVESGSESEGEGGGGGAGWRGTRRPATMQHGPGSCSPLATTDAHHLVLTAWWRGLHHTGPEMDVAVATVLWLAALGRARGENGATPAITIIAASRACAATLSAMAQGLVGAGDAALTPPMTAAWIAGCLMQAQVQVGVDVWAAIPVLAVGEGEPDHGLHALNRALALVQRMRHVGMSTVMADGQGVGKPASP